MGDAESAKVFGDRLLEAPRSFADRTSISGAIEFAMAQFARAPFESVRRTIDVSGDGTNNAGRDVTLARDEAVAKGVTINGLVILSATPLPWNPDHTNPPGGLDNYYRNNVVGGPGAFVLVAKDFNSFGEAIVEKMIAEVALAREQALRRAAAPGEPLPRLCSFPRSSGGRSRGPGARGGLRTRRSRLIGVAGRQPSCRIPVARPRKRHRCRAGWTPTHPPVDWPTRPWKGVP